MKGLEPDCANVICVRPGWKPQLVLQCLGVLESWSAPCPEQSAAALCGCLAIFGVYFCKSNGKALFQCVSFQEVWLGYGWVHMQQDFRGALESFSSDATYSTALWISGSRVGSSHLCFGDWISAIACSYLSSC